MKLKRDYNINGFMPAIICLSIASLVWIIIGSRQGLLAVVLFFMAYSLFSLWTFTRTRNLSYLAACLFQLMFGLYLLTRPRFHWLPFLDPKIRDLILLGTVAATIWLLYLTYTRKAKWKGREIFELASLSVEPLSDGFTDRPKPAGKAEYSRDDLVRFARFLRKNLVVMPFMKPEGIVLVPVKMGDEFGFLFNPERFRRSRTRIHFDWEGNVSVSISRKDYLDYRQELSFDELCDKLGILFVEFLGYFRKGEEDLILHRLNEAGLALTS